MTVVVVVASGVSVGVVTMILWWLAHSIGLPNGGVLDPGAPVAHVDPYCGTVPAPGFDRSPNHLHVGAYVNPVYGYAVSIPRDLKGFSPYGGAQKGFGIVLSWSPRAFLRVDAVYDVFYDITAGNVHRRDAGGVRLFDRLLTDTSRSYSLGGTVAGRYLMRVQCGKDPRIYIHDQVIAVRNREIYRLDLQSLPERYATDVRVLNAMLRTWRWIPLASSNSSRQ